MIRGLMRLLLLRRDGRELFWGMDYDADIQMYIFGESCFVILLGLWM